MGDIARQTPASRADEHRFWLAMVAAMCVLVLWGFGGSFFFRGVFPPRASYVDDPAVRLLYVAHGVSFTSWMALLAAQVGFAAGNRIKLHQRLGWASVVVLPIILLTGFAVGLHALKAGFHDAPPDLPAAAFFATPAISLTFFLGTAILALRWRRRPATHKRLMVIATLMIVGAGTSRIPQIAALGVPWFDLTQLLLLPMLWWDWRSLGRVHPATFWGGLALLAANSAMLPIGGTQGWQDLVSPLARL